MVFLRGVCGLHRAVLSGVFYCVYVRAPVYTSMCMYIPAYVCICVLPFCGKVQKLNISLKKNVCMYIYIYMYIYVSPALFLFQHRSVSTSWH